MSRTTREVMRPPSPEDRRLAADGTIPAETWIDAALAALLERRVDHVAVSDGPWIVGSVTAGELASSLEDTGTWGALCS